MIKVLY